MIERNGNIFDTTANYIGHGVNVHGLMGAGIAKQFRDEFPINYAGYKHACDVGSLTPGDFIVIADRLRGRKINVVNFASQAKPGPDAQYPWLFSSLYLFATQASRVDRIAKAGNVIAIPEIGCGIGGLKWKKVKNIIKCVESVVPDIEFEVWHYE